MKHGWKSSEEQADFINAVRAVLGLDPLPFLKADGRRRGRVREVERFGNVYGELFTIDRAGRVVVGGRVSRIGGR